MPQKNETTNEVEGQYSESGTLPESQRKGREALEKSIFLANALRACIVALPIPPKERASFRGQKTRLRARQLAHHRLPCACV